MLRCVLVAVAVVAALTLPTPAADPDLNGSWLITYAPRGGTSEINMAIVKVETRDGKPTATVVATPPAKGVGPAPFVREFKVSGKEVTVGLSTGASFVGVIGSDPKVILGGFGTDTTQFRARMARTDQTAIEVALTRGNPPEPMVKAQQLSTQPAILRSRAAQEQDPEKKKELTQQAAAAQKEADEKIPGLYREVVARHADDPVAMDAAAVLLQMAARANVTADEAAKLIALFEKHSAAHGEKFTRVNLIPALNVYKTILTKAGKADEAKAVAARVAKIQLVGAEAAAKNLTDADPPATQARVLAAYQSALQKAGRTAEAKDVAVRVGKLELAATEPAAKKLTDTDPPLVQSRALAAYLAALEKVGRTDEAKDVAARLARVEARIDEEYLAKPPAFPPEPFAGRKDRSANRVAVMELFTGAQCPPCVAADVAFDGLAKSYKPTDLVLIQYHLHIPGPDPMTNPDAQDRASYYGANSTPSTFFNGKSAAGGGGGMAAAGNKFKQYAGVIDPILEQTTPVKLAGKATRAGDKIDIAVDVAGAEGEDLKLRLLVVEETVRFSGGNGLRFHHHVVRAMPGGAEGVALKDRAMRHAATADVAEVRFGLEGYLTDFASTRPFPQPGRPLDMKHLKVIALVQSDKTKEILQAVQIEVEGTAAGTGGSR
jgi:hypothetical protein